MEKTKDTLRTTALVWWNNLPFDSTNNVSKTSYCAYYYGERNYQSLTGSEIEEIWKNDLPLEERENYYGIYKPNQKQFDIALFKAYIEKFTPADRVMAKVILESRIKQWEENGI